LSDTLKTAAYHIYSGHTYGYGENTFQKMDNGPYKQERDINLFYPFQSQAEWSLAKFLAENLTQAQINRFLVLPWVLSFLSAKMKPFNRICQFKSNAKPSFSSAEELLAWIATLPAGPKWTSTVLEVEGYKTTDPISFIWHDGLEVVESIFGDPIFGAHTMSFDPIHIETPSGREYDGWLSVREAHRIQASPL
jgi:hypothetical protein